MPRKSPRHTAEIERSIRGIMAQLNSSSIDPHDDLVAMAVVLGGIVAALAARDSYPLGKALDVVCDRVRTSAVNVALSPEFAEMMRRAEKEQ